MKRSDMLALVAALSCIAGAVEAATPAADFTRETGTLRRALHSSGWAPRSHPRSIQNDDARKMCDEFGFTSCELILNEWHYLLSWDGIHGKNSTPCDALWEGGTLTLRKPDTNSAAFLVTFDL